MALIKCIECGKEISDSAKRCPHCGCDAKKSVRAEREQQAQIAWENSSSREKSTISVIGIIIVLAVFVFLLKSCFYSGPSYSNHNDGKCDICGKHASYSGSGYEYCEKDYWEATAWIMNNN